MEHVHTSSSFRFVHEITEGVRLKPPTDDELTTVTDPDTGEEVQVPNEKWEREFENVELDTLVFVDLSGGADVSVYKFAFDKGNLAAFINDLLPHLDADGRQVVRDGLNETSDIIVPKIEAGKLKLVD